MNREFALIEKLKKRIPRTLQGLIPIGDDAGMITLAKRTGLLVSTDAIVEGVDFRMSGTDPALIGRKALAVNLSDMAAMAARPVAFVAAAGIPKGLGERWMLRFHEGMMRLAREYQVACLGGDLSRAREFFAAVTILGEAPKAGAVLRSGARPGDWIGVTGTLGGSILRHHYAFRPRVEEALFLRRHARLGGMIDISDGFLQDLEHVLRASRCGACLDLEEIPVSSDAMALARGDSPRALEHALTDGEDFELLFTVRPGDRKTLERLWPRAFPNLRLSWMGRVTKGRAVVRWQCGGRPMRAPKIKQKGFSHF